MFYNKNRFCFILYASVVGWAIFGYPLLVVIANLTSSDNSSLSITVRAMIVLMSLALIYTSSQWPSRWLIFLFGFFWTVYLLRLLLSLVILNDPVSFPHQNYWIWTLGICIIPSVAVLLTTSRSKIESLRTPFLFSLLFTSVFILLLGTSMGVSLEGSYDMGRWNLPSLNPISVAQLGASAMLFGLSSSTVVGDRRIIKLLSGLNVFFGTLLLILANSRGPFVATVICVIVFLLVKIKELNLRRCLISIGALLLAAIIAYNFLAIHIYIPNRFAEMAVALDSSTTVRFQMFQGALQQFLGSILIGDSIEEHSTHFYPHNIIIEAFMATGLIGGLPFLGLVILSLWSAFSVIKSKSQNSWVGLFTLQYIIVGQFSGSINQSGEIWVVMAMLLSYVYCSSPQYVKSS